MNFALPPKYERLTATTVTSYLDQHPSLAARLGGDRSAWRVEEVSDGYLNLVFLVTGSTGSVCVKQSLPHVRVDESWKLPLDRNRCERIWFEHVAPHVDRAIPDIYHHDSDRFILVIETLRPHEVLRTALIGGRRYPDFARDVGRFVANATFHTSDLFQRYEDKQEVIASLRHNDALHRIMRELVFQDPFFPSPRNHWTTPQLDDIVGQIHADPVLRLAASRIGYKFMTSTQALVHSDLHTGAVMATDGDTRIIDPEFGVYGAIGVDTGCFIAHLFMAYYSQPAYASAEDDRTAFQTWILEQIEIFWDEFRRSFLDLWRAKSGGDGYPAFVFADAVGAAALDAERERFLDEIWQDTLAYAAVKIIRSIIGYSHFGDLEGIADPDQKAASEAGALSLGRLLLVEPGRFASISDVTAVASKLQQQRRSAGSRLSFSSLKDI
ncbi:S-methyl-5-thioribose kinase [Oryzibacter oryziterrae]|uniref:S-methyl-5-thioribose kinase n=1 Tax=Oryzibacter oryziterrae TaxID=2766474 RepID=UPI001F011447|nr:S-methyl-5-thioribose kinase [Oryzibacter oryziterrae]